MEWDSNDGCRPMTNTLYLPSPGTTTQRMWEPQQRIQLAEHAQASLTAWKLHPAAPVILWLPGNTTSEQWFDVQGLDHAGCKVSQHNSSSTLKQMNVKFRCVFDCPAWGAEGSTMGDVGDGHCSISLGCEDLYTFFPSFCLDQRSKTPNLVKNGLKFELESKPTGQWKHSSRWQHHSSTCAPVSAERESERIVPSVCWFLSSFRPLRLTAVSVVPKPQQFRRQSYSQGIFLEAEKLHL